MESDLHPLSDEALDPYRARARAALSAFDRHLPSLRVLQQVSGRTEKLVRLVQRAGTGEKRNAHGRYKTMAARLGWPPDPTHPRRPSGPWEYVLAFADGSIPWHMVPTGELWCALIVVLARRAGLRAAPLTATSTNTGAEDPDACYLRGSRVCLDMFLTIVQGSVRPYGAQVAHALIESLITDPVLAGGGSSAKGQVGGGGGGGGGGGDEEEEDNTQGPTDLTDGQPGTADTDAETPHVPSTRQLHVETSEGWRLYRMSRQEATWWMRDVCDDWPVRPVDMGPAPINPAGFLAPVDVLFEPVNMDGIAIASEGPYQSDEV